MSNKLTKSESKQLEDLEAVIEVGVASFIEVGRALATINQQRLYRLSHATFAEYVTDRWGMITSQAYRYIAASEVVERIEMSPIGDKLPTNESQVRELAKLPAEEQAEAWEEVTQTTATPTAKVVKAVVEKRQEAKEGVPKKPANRLPADKQEPTKKETISHLKSQIKQHNAAMMRMVDELHGLAPNKQSHEMIHRCFRQIHEAAEAWK